MCLKFNNLEFHDAGVRVLGLAVCGEGLGLVVYVDGPRVIRVR